MGAANRNKINKTRGGTGNNHLASALPRTSSGYCRLYCCLHRNLVQRRTATTYSQISQRKQDQMRQVTRRRADPAYENSWKAYITGWILGMTTGRRSNSTDATILPSSAFAAAGLAAAELKPRGRCSDRRRRLAVAGDWGSMVREWGWGRRRRVGEE
jgi:hypothetical protein